SPSSASCPWPCLGSCLCPCPCPCAASCAWACRLCSACPHSPHRLACASGWARPGSRNTSKAAETQRGCLSHPALVQKLLLLLLEPLLVVLRLGLIRDLVCGAIGKSEVETTHKVALCPPPSGLSSFHSADSSFWASANASFEYLSLCRLRWSSWKNT